MPFRSRLLKGDLFSAITANTGNRSIIKSIQTGIVSYAGNASNTATITSINTANSILFYLGTLTVSSGFATDTCSRVELTNSTTVTATHANANGNVVGFCVMEFMPGVIKSLQRGTITLTSATTTQAITAVTIAKTILIGGGSSCSITDHATAEVYLTFDSATQISAKDNSFAASTTVAPYQVVEFY